MARWSMAYLRERLGERRLPSASLCDFRLVVDVRRGVALTDTGTIDVIARIERGAGDVYLMAPLDRVPSDLAAEVEVPALCRDATFRSSKLWVSPKGATSPLHFDLAHNLHAQIVGSKRFLVYERGQRKLLYPEAPWSSVPNFSRVDPLNPDLTRYPSFRGAVPFMCTLEPGDAVLLPSRTWHHVTSNAPSISVNFWWARGALGAFVRAADALKRARRISR